eukprot:10692179-Alexandrium_andersonii.AAC.1
MVHNVTPTAGLLVVVRLCAGVVALEGGSPQRSGSQDGATTTGTEGARGALSWGKHFGFGEVGGGEDGDGAPVA